MTSPRGAPFSLLGWCDKCDGTVRFSSAHARSYLDERGHARSTATAAYLEAVPDATIETWPPARRSTSSDRSL